MQHDDILKRASKNDIICYTDGSFKNGFGGAGICIVHPNPMKVERFGASLFRSTPLLSELVAIELCLLKLIKMTINKDQYVHIFCDSLGAIQTLYLLQRTNQWFIVSDREVLPTEFIWRLKILIAHCFFKVRFHHVKAHSGILGNEQADQIAKSYCRDSQKSVIY